jgi:NAD/NADP transhydrogenase beta subunit
VTVNWLALGEVFVVGLVTVAALVALFALGIRGVSQRVTARAGGGSGAGGLTVAVVCFAACCAVVLYGLSLIISH